MQVSMQEAKVRLASPRQHLPGEQLLTYTFLRCVGEMLPDQASPVEFLEVCQKAIKEAMFERSTGLNLQTLKLFAPLTQERFGALASLFVSPEFGEQVEAERERFLGRTTES